jgi:integrase/recombinase XerC
MLSETAMPRTSSLTLHDARQRFIRHLEAQSCSPHTIRSYDCDLRKLERFANRATRIAGIGPDDLNAFLTSDHALVGPRGERVAPGTVNRVRAVLRSFFGWLVEAGHLERSPATTLRVRNLRRPAPDVLAEADQEKLVAAMKDSDDDLALRDRALVELMLGTGIRLGEAVGLDAEDVDLDAGQITIRPKGGGRDTRYLPRRVRTLLRRYLGWRAERNGHCPALFVTAHGTRISQRHVHRRLAQWLSRAGIDRHLSPHSLRHTLAVRLLGQTGNLRLVQRALGHASIASTVRYAQVAGAALREALEAV